jgi:hypothetical protein
MMSRVQEDSVGENAVIAAFVMAPFSTVVRASESG